MRTLAVIPARGGSKGLPGKNARPFLGESLLGRAIRIAQETCDDLVVTTDSDDLAYIAAGYGAPVHMRPPELATDEAPMLPVVQDAILGREGDVIVLLQPTQPLRTAEQVRQALSMLNGAWNSVVSVRRVPPAYDPDRVMHIDHAGLKSSTGTDPNRRQDARPGYVRDGAVYAIWRGTIDRGLLLGWAIRPMILDGAALSIDTLEDFERLEALARRALIREDLAKEA